ncbi:alpha/beta hydrolase family esterase [Planctomycetota bacterium]
MLKIKIFIAIIICFVFQIAYGQWLGELLKKSMIHDEIERTYVIYMPSSLDSDPNGYPLLIGLHGTSSDGIGMMATAHLFSESEREKFIVACPDGLKYDLMTYFNAGEHYEELTDLDGDGVGTDDLGFISRIIDKMIINYPVDPNRVYVMGHSNGGIMAYRLTAQLPDKIAAIASNSGPMVYTEDPCGPVPIIHIHGLEDPLIPYEGTVLNGVTVPPVDTVMEQWRLVNGCDANYIEIYNETFPIYDEDEVFLYDNNIVGVKWPDPNGGNDIVLYTYSRGGHEWRSSTDGLAATPVFWDFLKQHRSTYADAVVPEPNTPI